MAKKTKTPSAKPYSASPKAERLVDLQADGFVSVERAAPAEEYGKRVAELLETPADRDVKLWSSGKFAMAVNINLTFSALANIPASKNNAETDLAMRRVIAAAKLQAALEHLIFPVLEASRRSSERVERQVAQMDKGELKEAAQARLVADRVKQKLDGEEQKKPSPQSA